MTPKFNKGDRVVWRIWSRDAYRRHVGTVECVHQSHSINGKPLITYSVVDDERPGGTITMYQGELFELGVLDRLAEVLG